LETATNVEIGNWQYSYSFSASQNAIDKTTVKTPVACIQYSHMGNASVDNLWRVGTLQDKTTYSDTSCVTALQKETYTWESELLSYDKQYLPRPTRLSIANTYLPRLSNSQIARETTTYTKTFTNYDGYGNSRNVVSQQSGQAAKTAVYTYDVKTVPWVLHLLDTEYYGFGSNPNIDRVYDGAGNLSSETVFGKTNSYAYSGGEVSSHTDPDGKLTTYSSYQMGRSTSESRPEGVSISRSVDSYGNVWLESYGALPVTKIPVGHSDLAISISYGYDNANRITSISTPSTTDSNYGISYVLGGGSNSRTITRGSSRTTESFDEWGNKTGLVREDTSAGVVNPKITTFFRYDAVGRLQYEYYPVFSGTAPLAKTYTYDALNRVKAIANNSDGSSIGYAYQADNKIVVTDEAGNPTTYSYRAFDNPDEKQLMNIAAPQGQTTTIDRNILGMINFVQQGGVTHTYGYDTRMLLTSETRPEFGTINYDRDNRGNMTARKVGSAPQAITTFVYDDLGRLTSIDYPGATPDVSRIWYNKFSKPWQVIRGDSQWDYTYDANNNLTNEALALSGAIGKTLSVQRGYDGLDQEISITYPSGKLIGEPRDALDRIQSLSQPGGLGTLVSGVKYRASGNFEQYTYGNNRATTVTESVRRWPEQFTVSGGGVADFKYTYFSTGDVSGITDYVNGSRTRTFGYDGLHRLASVTGSGAWGSAAFTYSTTGNILTKNIGGNTTTLNYDTTNRPYSITNASGTQSYGYDKYGNVISKGSQNFFYDDSSNLIWDGTTAAPPNYAYDGHNHRYWQKDAAGSETLSVYSLSGKLMYQEGKQDRSVRDYVYLDDTLVARADYCDTTRDTDGDGVPDCTEASAGTNPDVADSSLDKDGDGLTNLREYQLGTKINSADSDTDGLPDGYEVANGLNPLSSTDAHADADGDGLDNYAEYLAGTNPRNADSDGDGIVDGQDTTPLLNIAAVLVPIFYLLLN
jgi:YD repeat-containing protein